ncbi:head-tail connector protein [Xanthobacter autotrophicus]|uniref:head-tail connector protein n=1 Tax=Xanthobacter autotrophicus TaxID=280 RepID=UPI0037270199
MILTLDIVSLADLKAHLNVTTDDDDALLTGMLETARGYVESWCGPLDDIAGTIPAGFVHALKLYVGHLYENRETVNIGNIVSEIPMGFFDLIGPYRKWAFSDD